MSTAIQAFVTLFECPAFLVPDKHHLLSVQFGETRDQSSVVSEGLVTVQFDEFIEESFVVVGAWGCLVLFLMALGNMLIVDRFSEVHPTF